MSDSLQELAERLVVFRDERDWERYHTPRNLAQSVAIEAGELLECFQWDKQPIRSEIADECADVLIYVLQVAERCEVDLGAAIEAKIAKNAERYPAVRRAHAGQGGTDGRS